MWMCVWHQERRTVATVHQYIRFNCVCVCNAYASSFTGTATLVTREQMSLGMLLSTTFEGFQTHITWIMWMWVWHHNEDIHVAATKEYNRFNCVCV